MERESKMCNCHKINRRRVAVTILEAELAADLRHELLDLQSGIMGRNERTREDSEGR